jgi:hypothetical protein
MPNFRRYSAYYDLLYRDKDYAAEAEYVARLIRSTLPEARRILELGSGTGRHGCLLAAMGFDVHGSYQASNEALQAVFQVATDHLGSCGVFLFDVWHGPAVLSQPPTERVKEVADDCHRVRRTAHPELDTNRSTVKVVYEMDCEDRRSRQTARFSEEHLMRYLFPTEVDLLARNCGLRRVRTEEFLSGKPPSPSTWSVLYMFER